MAVVGVKPNVSTPIRRAVLGALEEQKLLLNPEERFALKEKGEESPEEDENRRILKLVFNFVLMGTHFQAVVLTRAVKDPNLRPMMVACLAELGEHLGKLQDKRVAEACIDRIDRINAFMSPAPASKA